MSRVIRGLKRAVIAKARTYSESPYVKGGTSYDGIDCRGLVRKAFGIEDGLRLLVGGALGNVREFTKWAEENGRLVAEPQRGDVFLWGDANSPDHRPVYGAGHMGIVIQPPSAKHPDGLAISAYNPKKGIIEHGLTPPPGHLAVFGYIRPDWVSFVEPAEPPPADPEEPVAE